MFQKNFQVFIKYETLKGIMQPYKVLWEGRSPVTDLHMKFSEKYKYQPSESLQKERDVFWKAEQDKYPGIYDGEMLFCMDFEVKDIINFKVGLLHYSYLNLILRKGIQFPPEQGYFAFRAWIRVGDQFIIGQKSNTAQFDPLHYTFPGGLIEIKDLDGGIFAACQREVIEETALQIDADQVELIAINKQRRQNGVILLFEIHVDESELVENEEWEKLHWVTLEEIKTLDYNLLHDDIRYVLEHKELLKIT